MNPFMTPNENKVLLIESDKTATEELNILGAALVDLSFISIEGSILDSIKRIITKIKAWLKKFFSSARERHMKKELEAANVAVTDNRDAIIDFLAQNQDWLVSEDGIPDKILTILHMITNTSVKYVLNYSPEEMSEVSEHTTLAQLRLSNTAFHNHLITDRLAAIEFMNLKEMPIYDHLQYILDKQVDIIKSCDSIIDYTVDELDVMTSNKQDRNAAAVSKISLMTGLAKDVLVVTATNTSEIHNFLKRLFEKIRDTGVILDSTVDKYINK